MMKKKLSIIIIIVLVSMSLIFSGCYKKRMLDYYSNDSNYETLEVTIVAIDEEYLKVNFKDKDVHEHYTYKPFQLIDMPNLCSELTVGDEISIITAPRYFYDEYLIPIVGISKGEIVYLDFESGKQNLLKYIEQTQQY